MRKYRATRPTGPPSPLRPLPPSKHTVTERHYDHNSGISHFER